MIGLFADDAHMLFRAGSVGAIVVPRPSIAYIRSGDRGRRFGGLFGFLLGVSDNSAEGMKNGCLRGSNESPHFTRPNSMERRTL